MKTKSLIFNALLALAGCTRQVVVERIVEVPVPDPVPLRLEQRRLKTLEEQTEILRDMQRTMEYEAANAEAARFREQLYREYR